LLSGRCVRPTIGEALAAYAFQGVRCAGLIIDPEFDPVAVPEIEVSQVAVQVVLCAVMPGRSVISYMTDKYDISLDIRNGIC